MSRVRSGTFLLHQKHQLWKRFIISHRIIAGNDKVLDYAYFIGSFENSFVHGCGSNILLEGIGNLCFSGLICVVNAQIR